MVILVSQGLEKVGAGFAAVFNISADNILDKISSINRKIQCVTIETSWKEIILNPANAFSFNVPSF